MLVANETEEKRSACDNGKVDIVRRVERGNRIESNRRAKAGFGLIFKLC